MNAAYFGEHNTKPLTEQQLKVTCLNDHVGHVPLHTKCHLTSTPAEYQTIPVAVLLAFPADYSSPCLYDDSRNFKPQFL
jgi:hypothetical protein